MRYELKDYQSKAVRDVLANLEKARHIFHSLGDSSQFALTATTGAGKTVMAAAAIEALFHGDDDMDFAPDPSAVVLWFSDDPNLNEQTRFRLMAASDRLVHSDLVVIQHPFAVTKLAPGRVYFLNTGKLTKTSLLTRGHQSGDDEHLPNMAPSMTPDLQPHTIWETLANTIQDPNLTLYLVLDEAHRGFGTKVSADKPTIVRRLINGHAGVPPIPVVWGISATVQRFEEAMADAHVSDARLALRKVVVDSEAVQESGLLKDTIMLEIPAEAGMFDTVLLARAARKARESSREWTEYALAQRGEFQALAMETVVPLLILQLPNTPDPDMVARALDVVFQEWPELPSDAVAHVLGDHTTQQWGQFEVPYVAPERVQEMSGIRVLLAKDAISTGWDCPRAEVLMSFRPAKDATHITQLLGRMVRTPLARRIPGNEKLNSVECLLPFFDRKTAVHVIQALMGGLDDFPGVPTGRKVVISPQQMLPNRDIPSEVWDALEGVPSHSLPRAGAKPVKRLTALAQALATDRLRLTAGKDAHAELHAVLDGCLARYADKLRAAVSEVWTVHGETVRAQGGDPTPAYEQFTESADDRSIREAFRHAARIISPDLAGTYVDHLAGPDDPSRDDDGLRDAHVQVAALSLVPEVAADLDHAARKLSEKWFDDYRVAIKDLSDERQAVYNDIRAMSVEPQQMSITRPKNVIVETMTRDADGNDVPLPTRKRHLLADTNGDFPVGALNGWELEVLDKEMARPGAAAWYRNPSRSAQEALTVAYRDADGGWRSMRPDFLFFDEHGGEVRVSVVDPHSHHLSDALSKLRGLAEFAAQFGTEFHRVEAISRLDGRTRVLDMKDSKVRAAVSSADDVKALYASAHARAY